MEENDNPIPFVSCSHAIEEIFRHNHIYVFDSTFQDRREFSHRLSFVKKTIHCNTIEWDKQKKKKKSA